MISCFWRKKKALLTLDGLAIVLIITKVSLCVGSILRMKLPLSWFWGKWGHLWGRAPWTWSWPGPPGCWGVHCIGLWLHCPGLTWLAPFLSFVICLSVFKRFVSPPRCFFKFCYLFVFIQKIHPLVVFLKFCYLLFFKRFVSPLVVICLFLFKRFVSPPRCFFKFCYLLFI